MSANIQVFETAPLEWELAAEEFNQAKKALSMPALRKTGSHGTQFPRSPSAPLRETIISVHVRATENNVPGNRSLPELGMETYILVSIPEKAGIRHSSAEFHYGQIAGMSNFPARGPENSSATGKRFSGQRDEEFGDLIG